GPHRATACESWARSLAQRAGAQGGLPLPPCGGDSDACRAAARLAELERVSPPRRDVGVLSLWRGLVGLLSPSLSPASDAATREGDVPALRSGSCCQGVGQQCFAHAKSVPSTGAFADGAGEFFDQAIDCDAIGRGLRPGGGDRFGVFGERV